VGETGFVEPAILDRTIPVSMSKMDSAPFEENFSELKNVPLENVGRSILQMALKISAEKVAAMIDEELQEVSASLKDRPRYNSAVARFGIRMLSEITKVKFDPSHIDQALIDHVYGTGKVRKSAVDKILEAMNLMSGIKKSDNFGTEYNFNDHLEEDVHYSTSFEEIRIHVAGAYPVFKKWARAHYFDGDLLPESTFKKQLKKEIYFIENKVVRFDNKTRNAFILDLHKMREKGLEISEEWKIKPVLEG
jgi:hypothetical protein